MGNRQGFGLCDITSFVLDGIEIIVETGFNIDIVDMKEIQEKRQGGNQSENREEKKETFLTCFPGRCIQINKDAPKRSHDIDKEENRVPLIIRKDNDCIDMGRNIEGEQPTSYTGKNQRNDSNMVLQTDKSTGDKKFERALCPCLA